MQTTFTFESAQDIPVDILEKIRDIYKSGPITIIVNDSAALYLTDDQKNILDARLNEDTATYLSADETIEQLKNKYGI